jgi:coproporphyrinogen III oxidase-like Fe-S oxidoreductase
MWRFRSKTTTVGYSACLAILLILCFSVFRAFTLQNPLSVARKSLHRRRSCPELLALHERKSTSSVDTTSLTQSHRDVSVERSPNAAVGLYIHIPYCRRRCRYCDFSIVPVGSSFGSDQMTAGHTNEDRQNRGFDQMNEEYTAAILKELRGISDCIRENTDSKVVLSSVYFGGGTPSLAPVTTLRRIMDYIRSNESMFELVADGLDATEITMEMDPGTFSLSKLQSTKDLGVNRISLGVQSFDDEILKHIGRTHRVQDIHDAISMIEQVYGCNEDSTINYSLDLISGLPGLDLALWSDTLATAVQLRPPPTHLSVYDLQIEQGTVFGTWYGENAVGSSEDSEHPQIAGGGGSPLPSAFDIAYMYKYAAGYLRSRGYEHYEVSSYARKENSNALEEEKNEIETSSSGMLSFRSRHNQIYWNPEGQWYAVGLGATSFVRGQTFARPKAMSDYLSWVQETGFAAAAGLGQADTQGDDYEIITDMILKRLRTSDGLSLEWVRDRFPNRGESYVESILRGTALALDLRLASYNSDNQVIRLSDPSGFLFSNSIISGIFFELSASFSGALD